MELTEDLPFRALRRTWQPVANAADLPAGRVIGYTLLDTELVVARFADGSLLAADVACPHKGARLSAGGIADNQLVCPYHGWRFEPNGACASIPSLLEPNPEKFALSHLKTYPARERYGYVWVKLDPAGRHDLPSIPEFEDPAWTYVMGPPMRFATGYRREIENFLDMTHFAFAHRTTLGKAADMRVPEMKITILEDGNFQMDAPFPSLATFHEAPGKLQSAHHRRQRCHLPNFSTVRQTFDVAQDRPVEAAQDRSFGAAQDQSVDIVQSRSEGAKNKSPGQGDERLLVHIPSPNTRETCTVFWSLAISPGFEGPSPAEQIDFAVRVLDEDRRACELQIPAEVPINPGRGGWGVLVTPGDTLANTFQKQFRRWLQAEATGLEKPR